MKFGTSRVDVQVFLAGESEVPTQIPSETRVKCQHFVLSIHLFDAAADVACDPHNFPASPSLKHRLVILSLTAWQLRPLAGVYRPNGGPWFKSLNN